MKVQVVNSHKLVECYRCMLLLLADKTKLPVESNTLPKEVPVVRTEVFKLSNNVCVSSLLCGGDSNSQNIAFFTFYMLCSC